MDQILGKKFLITSNEIKILMKYPRLLRVVKLYDEYEEVDLKILDIGSIYTGDKEEGTIFHMSINELYLYYNSIVPNLVVTVKRFLNTEIENINSLLVINQYITENTPTNSIKDIDIFYINKFMNLKSYENDIFEDMFAKHNRLPIKYDLKQDSIPEIIYENDIIKLVFTKTIYLYLEDSLSDLTKIVSFNEYGYDKSINSILEDYSSSIEYYQLNKVKIDIEKEVAIKNIMRLPKLSLTSGFKEFYNEYNEWPVDSYFDFDRKINGLDAIKNKNSKHYIVFTELKDKSILCILYPKIKRNLSLYNLLVNDDESNAMSKDEVLKFISLTVN